MTENEIVTGYKVTDKNMKCRGFQYELGKWYECEGKLELCKNGFHFCEYPSGPWAYYYNGRLFKVEASGVIKSTGPGADLKHVARKIRLIEEIKINGDGNTGYGNTGDGNTGDGNTGGGNTGDGNTGYGNTGDGNTGDRNTGDRNTGDGNTGDGNTGDGNTGDGNTGDYHSGSLCNGEAPFFLFNLPASREKVDFNLIHNLSVNLQKDDEIDPTPYLKIENATPERIKALHDAHKATRKDLKG